MGDDEVAITTRFFKIMMSGFKEKMTLPPAFCKKIKEDKYLRRAILKSRKGRYEVKVSRNSNQVYFKGGWPQFVDDHGLRLGDVLVFEHIQDLQFYVSVFGSSACEERYLPINRNETERPTQPIHRARKNSKVLDKTFTVKMTHYMASKLPRVIVPISFVIANNLKHKKSASLRIGVRRWEVKLWSGESRGYRMLMCGGWHQFYAANKLQVGDVCVFQLNPTSSSSSTTVSFDVLITRCSFMLDC